MTVREPMVVSKTLAEWVDAIRGRFPGVPDRYAAIRSLVEEALAAREKARGTG